MVSRVQSAKEPASEDSLGGWWLVSVFATALGVRLVHLFQIIPAPFFPFKMGDAASYDAWAQRISAGDWWGTEVFYQAPLYPYFLAVVYTCVGDDTFSIRLVQAAIGAAACVLLTIAGWKIFSGRVGIVAGLLLAVYAPAIFFDSLVQKSVLDSLWVCALLALWGLSLHRSHGGLWWSMGMVLGALVLTRENALLLLVAVSVSVLTRVDMERRARWHAAAIFLGGMLAVLAPVAARNYFVGGEFHLTTSQFGPNFYIGNHAEATGTYRSLRPYRGSAQYERQDARELAESATGRSLSDAEVSRYWSGEAWRFIGSQPVAWARLMAWKAALTVNGVELVDTEDVYSYAQWSWPLWVSGQAFHFGILVPLAVWGMWCTWPDRARLRFLYWVIGCYAVGVIMFYVVGRYRFPLVPPLVLFASVGLVGLRRGVTSATPRPRVMIIVLLAVLAVACNYPLASMARMRATMHYNVGVELEAIEAFEAAIVEYEEALRLDPDRHGVRNNLGCARMAVGDYAEAIRQFTLAVEGDAEFAEAYYNLGTVQLASGALEQAEWAMRRFVELRPELPRAHYALAVVAQRRGDQSTATAALRRALEIDPELSEARELLERLESPPHKPD